MLGQVSDLLAGLLADAELVVSWRAAGHPCGGRPYTSDASARMKSVPPPEKIHQESPLRSSRPSNSSIGWYTIARVRAAEPRMPGRGQPPPARGLEFIGGDTRRG